MMQLHYMNHCLQSVLEVNVGLVYKNQLLAGLLISQYCSPPLMQVLAMCLPEVSQHIMTIHFAIFDISNSSD